MGFAGGGRASLPRPRASAYARTTSSPSSSPSSDRAALTSKSGPLRKVAIVQSSYIPWKGYFDLIATVDEFILFDDRQYTKRDWRNRNRIKTPQGAKWLTIPVETRGRFSQRIDETLTSEPRWARDHWTTLLHCYSRAAHFAHYRELFEERYLGCTERRLSRINRAFIETICEILGIRTRISWSTDYDVAGNKTERLVNLCRKVGAGEYLSGPSAKAYLREELFGQAGIQISYMDYSGYPEYRQLFPPFVHEVTVLDLIFNMGAEAPGYMKAFAQNRYGG